MSDAKRVILARRAQFVAAAMASLGAEACGKERAAPPAPETEVNVVDAGTLAAPPAFPPPAPPPPIPTAAPTAIATPVRSVASPRPPAPSPKPCLYVLPPDEPDPKPKRK